MLNLHKADGILARDSSDSPTFHEHSKDELQHIRKTKKQTNQKKNILSHRTKKLFVDWYTYIPATVASVSRSTMGIVSFQKIFKITFSYCHWLVSIYKQYTSTHLVSNVILLCTKITTDLQQDKDMFFFFPFGGSVLCKCVCKHSFDSSSRRKRTMCHTSEEIIQPNDQTLYSLIVHI